MKRALFSLLTVLLLAGGCVNKGVQWQAYTPEAFDAAKKSGQPVVLLFSAAWCPTCYEMKETTFTDTRVINELTPFQRIKADMSFRYSPKIQELGRQFRIQGYPTLLFYDPQGEEIGDLRAIGLLTADQLLDVLSEIRRRYPGIAAAPLAPS